MNPPETGVGIAWLVAGALLLAALVLGVAVSFVLPELRRNLSEPPPAPPATPAPAPSPVPPAPVRAAPRLPTARIGSPRVVGYAMVNAEDDDPDVVTAALALRCADQEWSLLEVIRDRRGPGGRLRDRPGLMYAVNMLRSRRATGLIVARIGDFTDRAADLATLLEWVAGAGAFLGAADHELDTSTRAGQGTARAVIDLARWGHERDDLARAGRRFRSADPPAEADLTLRIAAMHRRGLSLRAIADALNLIGVTAPTGADRWRAVDVKTLTEDSTMRM